MVSIRCKPGSREMSLTFSEEILDELLPALFAAVTRRAVIPSAEPV
jgi:hypothetical protein